MILWLSRAMISIFRYLYRILLYSVLCFSNKPELVEKDLIDIPEFIVRGFIRKMDLKERIIIRTKSSSLRDIDDMVPLKVDGIVLKSTPSEISLSFEGSLKFIFSGNNRLQEAMTQLLIVLNHPKLDLRSIRFDFFREDTDEQIMDIFSTRLTFGICVKLLHFENCSFQNLLTLLEHTTPKILNEIWITGRIHRQYNPDTIDRIFQLEQWKKAKTLVITGGLFGSMEHFSHFEELALYISGFTLQKNWADTIVIRQILRQFSNLKKMEFFTFPNRLQCHEICELFEAEQISDRKYIRRNTDSESEDYFSIKNFNAEKGHFKIKRVVKKSNEEENEMLRLI